MTMFKTNWHGLNGPIQHLHTKISCAFNRNAESIKMQLIKHKVRQSMSSRYWGLTENIRICYKREGNVENENNQPSI
jgi:hypothetical protein